MKFISYSNCFESHGGDEAFSTHFFYLQNILELPSPSSIPRIQVSALQENTGEAKMNLEEQILCKRKKQSSIYH